MENSVSLFDVSVVDVSAEQLRALDVDGLLARADPPAVGWFVFPIRDRRLKLEQEGQHDEAELLRLLEVVVDFGFNQDDSRKPFTAKGWLRDGRRTALVEDFSEGHFTSLERVRDTVTNTELKARLSDVLWQRRRRKVEDAKAAVAAYLQCAAVTTLSWFERHQRMKRAFQIATSISRGVPEPLVAVEGAILDQARTLEADATYYGERLMRLLLQTQRSNEEKREFAERAQTGGDRAMNEGDPRRAREYFETAANWLDSLSAVEEAKTARVRAAETVVASALAQPQRIAKAGMLSEALQALRNAGAATERIAEIRLALDAAQRDSLADMATISVPFDVTDMAESARASVRGRSFEEALDRLTRLFSIPEVSKLRREVNGLIDKYPLRMMIASRRVDSAGRVTGIRDGLMGEPERREEAILAEMREAAKRHWTMAVLGVIEPYRKEMLLEHAPSLDDFFRIVRDQPFVPADRAEFFARGLHAGFYGDFLEASHLLIPQVENSLRTLLSLTGTIVYGQTSRGIQDFMHLNDVLSHPELARVLNEDFVFDLTGLLVDRFGGNFRNELSHGLLGPSAAGGIQAAYVWWMTLRLVLGLQYVGDEA
jgi:hypothetical protein